MWFRNRHSIWGAALIFFVHAVVCLGSQVSGSEQKVSSAYGVLCQATYVVTVNSTQQVVNAIKAYYQAAGSQPVYIRATHRDYHSTANFPCASATAGPAGSGAGLAVAVDILMQDMNQLMSVDKATKIMTVQAGMTIIEMISFAKQAGLQVPLMAVPNYGGLTMGGIISTVATGTGTAGSPSTLCDIILSMQWVDGTGKVHTSARDSPEGRAICGGLGVLGVITELTLQLQEPGKVYVKTNARVEDTQLADDVTKMLQVTPHVTVTWRPDLGSYTAYMFSASNSTDPINATIYQVDRPASDVALLSQALRDWQNDVYNLNPLLSSVMCGLVAPMSSVDIHWAVDLKTQQGLEHALADGNDILSSACHGGPDGSCSFTSVGHIGVGDIHFTVDLPDLAQWVSDVKAIIAQDLFGATTGTVFSSALLKQDKVCLPPGYFWLRFGNPSNDYVGLNSAPYKQPVHVQLSLFRNREQGTAPMKNHHVLSVLEQLTLCRYKGRPHFGKNYDRTFTYSKCPLSLRYPQWSAWTSAAKQYDPLGLFASPLVGTVLRNGSYTASPGCGITGQCFCETDEHCSTPISQGWRCVPSKAFPEFKACRPVL